MSDPWVDLIVERTMGVPPVMSSFVLTTPTDLGLEPVLTCSVTGATTSMVHLVGELDGETAPLLTSVVTGHVGHGHLDWRLDLGELEFCNARGLSALWDARQLLVAAGGRLTILHPSALLHRVARVCGLQSLVETAA